MTLAQFFGLQLSSHAIVVRGAESVLPKPMRRVRIAGAENERTKARNSRKLLSELIAFHKTAKKK